MSKQKNSNWISENTKKTKKIYVKPTLAINFDINLDRCRVITLVLSVEFRRKQMFGFIKYPLVNHQNRFQKPKA